MLAKQGQKCPFFELFFSCQVTLKLCFISSCGGRIWTPIPCLLSDFKSEDLDPDEIYLLPALFISIKGLVYCSYVRNVDVG